jgi:hypothetical protein
VIRIERTIYWRRGDASDDRLDRWLGIADRSVSVVARELCCRAAMGVSFRKASENLQRLGQIRVSHERLRNIVEAEGRNVVAAQKSGSVGPNWDASDCPVEGHGRTRVIVGSDGVKVPIVTKAEKDKRRKNRRRGRRVRKAGRMARTLRQRRKTPRRRQRYPGSDNPYKEFKIVTFYDSSREHQYAVGTSGNHEVLGRLARREAAKLKLGQADEKFSVSDGAEWIRNQFRIQLPMLDAMILDYFHLAEHVAKAARVCFGEGSEEAGRWRREVMTAVWDQGPAAMLVHIHQTRGSVRAKAKREELRQLEQYVAKRCDMLDYPAFRAKGYDLGSGPTEAFCKTLTTRLKGSGMRWDLPNAEAMMALAAVDRSRLWQDYWTQQRKLAG